MFEQRAKALPRTDIRAYNFVYNVAVAVQVSMNELDSGQCKHSAGETFRTAIDKISLALHLFPDDSESSRLLMDMFIELKKRIFVISNGDSLPTGHRRQCHH